jgi:hypothetical protein
MKIEDTIPDIREGWTEKKWNEYNQVLAEEYEKEDEQMAQDFLEMEADY